jgi:hypothetical protein
MEITSDVILDLLPLYLAGEASPDTSALVEKYLETDPELAQIAQDQKENMKLAREVPVPLSEEDKMKTYRKTRWVMVIYIVVLAIFISLILGVTLLAFFVSSPPIN